MRFTLPGGNRGQPVCQVGLRFGNGDADVLHAEIEDERRAPAALPGRGIHATPPSDANSRQSMPS